MPDWSRWSDLTARCPQNGPAVYEIRVCASGIPLRVGRFLRTDMRGILCIGMTTNVRRRIRDFIKGLSRGLGHSEANLLHRLEQATALGRLIWRRSYEYRFIAVDSKTEACRLEERLIKRYVKRFGEVPPLNSVIPNRYLSDGW